MKPHEYMNEIYSAFRKRDAKKLRKLDESMMREASLAYSKKLFYMAVISYVLSKILSKPRFLEPHYKDRIDAIEKSLETISLCKDEDCPEDKFVAHFQDLEKRIKNIEAEDARFVIDLLSKGKLKVAATLYAQGMSLGTAAEITSVEKHEILSYAGHTMMFDRMKEEMTVQARLKALKALVEG